MSSKRVSDNNECTGSPATRRKTGQEHNQSKNVHRSRAMTRQAAAAMRDLTNHQLFSDDEDEVPSQGAQAGSRSQVSQARPPSQVSQPRPTSQVSQARPTSQVSQARPPSQVSQARPTSQVSQARPRSPAAQEDSSEQVEELTPLQPEASLPPPRVLDEIFLSGHRKEYPPKFFKFGEVEQSFTAILNFFKCDTVFEERPRHPIEFKCLLPGCPRTYHEKLGKVGNLNRHLRRHTEMRMVRWFEGYDQANSKVKVKRTLDKNMVLLVKYFLSSNSALIELQNSHLRDLLGLAGIKLPDYNTFRNNFLPSIMDELTNSINVKLQNAENICLVTDIWTTKQMFDFIALSANLSYASYERETIVIGMMLMPGNHCAENIKTAVETLTNKFDFDKSKIHGITTDEGAALLRLFKQFTNDQEQQLMFGDEYGALVAEDGDGQDQSQYDSVSFEDAERDILEAINHAEQLKLGEIVDDGDEVANLQMDLVEEDEYETTRGALVTTLNITLGSADLPRFSCACHKANISVRMAIKHHPVAAILAQLSRYSTSTKHSIDLAQIHIENKARLRCENETRWSSSYLMLESFQKAYRKGCFQEEEDKCPVPLAKIELYISILRPAYMFSLLMQRNASNICEVVPALLKMFAFWKHISENARYNAKTLSMRLTSAFMLKFKFELNSHLYQVAAILDVARLKLWFNKPYSQETVDCAFTHLVPVIMSFGQAKAPEAEDQDRRPKTPSTAGLSAKDPLAGFFNSDPIFPTASSTRTQTQEQGQAIAAVYKSTHIEQEKAGFIKLLKESDINKIESTIAFWYKHQKRFPYLSEAARKVINIPASSAYVERYFSLCGAICKPRTGNQNPDLIVMRSLLKSNLHLIEQ